MNRKSFIAAVGEVYRNQGGGSFLCKTAPDQAGGQIMQNTVSKWTFRAQGIGIYEDGSIDWDYSTGGYFQTDDQDQEEEKDVRICPICEKEVDRADMDFWRRVTTGNITTKPTNRLKQIIERKRVQKHESNSQEAGTEAGNH